MRKAVIGGTFVLVFLALAIGQVALQRRVSAQPAKKMVQAPRFEVDPLWPKPLPNHWIYGNVIGLGVDAQDHIFIIHRTAITTGNINPKEAYAAQKPPASDCCNIAPPVLEFDPEGNVVRAWGGPADEYEWPESNHGISVDAKGNLWIGGNGQGDAHILKFTHDGKFIKQFGFAWAGAGSNDTWAFNRVAKVFLDDAANEAYVADGYGNHRVAVIDMDTGDIKRYWGAYGEKPDDTNLGRYQPGQPPARQFRTPVHCAELSKDGLVYVCDRPNDRIQIFQKSGKFVDEIFVETNTLGDGSTWDIAFSRDPQQKYMFLADGTNEKIHVFDRVAKKELTNFGDGGRQPGEFYAVHSIATDSKGNIYTTETYEGKRLQKFVYKGIDTVPEVQGVVWPKGK